MTEADYLEVIELLREKLHSAGLESLASQEPYLTDIGGERAMPPARVQLKEMLAAFERHLGTQDHRTYEKAMKAIRSAADADNLVDVVTLRTSRAAEDGAEVRRLSDVPDLSGVRRSIKQLMRMISYDQDDFAR